MKALITKRHPELPQDITKLSGYEAFRKNSSSVVAALNDYYKTLCDCVSVLDESFVAVVECGTNAAEVRYDVATDWSNYWCQLVVRYVQLNALIAQLESATLFVTAFAVASAMLSAPMVSQPLLDKSYADLTRYLGRTGSGNVSRLVRVMQDDMERIATIIGTTAISFQAPIFMWSNVKTLRDSKIFALHDDVSGELRAYPSDWPALDKAERESAEICSLERMKQFVLIAFLLCPAELNRGGAPELLRLCLADSPHFTLFRDVDLPLPRRAHPQRRRLAIC